MSPAAAAASAAAASSSGRAPALALFRRILRTARAWQGPAEERAYIVSEARDGFRAGRHLGPEEAAAKLAEAEQRLELGVHYGIAYPRLHHTPQQFKRRTYLALPQLPPRAAGGGAGGGGGGGGS